MTDLGKAWSQYLALRRSLGFRLQRDEKLLRQFLNYLQAKGVDTVTVADALDWAKLPAPASAGWLGMRLSVVRTFAAWLRTVDAVTEVPPRDLLPGRGRRAVPYLYSAAEIAALSTQAAHLKTPLRTATIRTVIGLLAATGMRIGEVVALDDADFNAHHGLLMIRHAKQGDWRQIPLHPTTIS